MMKKTFPIKIRLKKAKLADAVFALGRFSESEILDSFPKDIADFQSALNFPPNESEEARSLKMEFESDWIERFQSRWDFDDEATRKSREAFRTVQGPINLAAKYFYSWELICSIIVFRRQISTELVLESKDDLKASYLLAWNGHYKQAYQLIRNYLENAVAILYFAVDKEAKKRWEQCEYQFMKFHKDDDKRDMLSSLSEYIDPACLEALSKRYSGLNSSVHSKRNRINWRISRIELELKDCGAAEAKRWSQAFSESIRIIADIYLRTLFISEGTGE